jgi:hypothetical protein
MSKKLEDITACHVCRGGNLQAIGQYPVEDIMTGESMNRTVLFCHDCETVHYIEYGEISYEFSYKIGQYYPSKTAGDLREQLLDKREEN